MPSSTDKTDKTVHPQSFVSSVSASPSIPEAEMPAFPIQDPAFWAGDFGKWALETCTCSHRFFFSVKVLHDHFCDWCTDQDTVGCMLETFAALLEDEGFLLAGGLASSLMLKADLKLLAAEYPVLRSKAGPR